MSIFNALLLWPVEARYHAGNPLALSRRPRRLAAPRVTRFLPMEHWEERNDRGDTDDHAAHAARTSAAPPWPVFFVCRAATGVERWWLEVTGKGSKPRLVPTTAELLAELIRYRRRLGVCPLPEDDDHIPFMPSIIGPQQPLSRSAIHEIEAPQSKGIA